MFITYQSLLFLPVQLKAHSKFSAFCLFGSFDKGWMTALSMPKLRCELLKSKLEPQSRLACPVLYWAAKEMDSLCLAALITSASSAAFLQLNFSLKNTFALTGMMGSRARGRNNSSQKLHC